MLEEIEIEAIDLIKVGDYVNVFQSLQYDSNGVPTLKGILDEVINVYGKEIEGKELGIFHCSQVRRVMREENGKLLKGPFSGYDIKTEEDKMSRAQEQLSK